MNVCLDLSPVPTLLVSPSFRVQRVSKGLLEEWNRRSEEFMDADLFTALYAGSATERFDRIPLTHAIKDAIAARNLRICYAAYEAGPIAWSARIIPIFKDHKLLWLLIEWERTPAPAVTNDDEWTMSWLPIDEAFRTLIQTVKDYAIFLLDTRGNVVTWNAGAALLKGYVRDEIVGKHFSIFYGEVDLQARKPEIELEICLREGRVEDEGWRYRKDGSRFWASVVITAVYKSGVHVGFGKVTRDLTERKEAELRLIAAYEESSKLKNDFLANMSHEIRTPMHGMLSACTLLLDTTLTEDQREMANIIRDSGHVLLRVINDILDYSKLSSNNFSISSGSVDVANIVASVVRSQQLTLHPGVRCEYHPGPDLPKLALGDPLRYRQIIQNIIDNAGKFTEEGSISVTTKLLTEDKETYTILTEIKDTGIGVSHAAAIDLFKPFVQVDLTTKKLYQGTGLGLSIAKSLAELMDGQIGYRPNEDPHGSIFWFSVRLNKMGDTKNEITKRDPAGELSTAPQAEALLEEEEDDGSLARLTKLAPTKRVLVAEDNIINQRVLIGTLHKFGFRDIGVASDGAEAVSLVSSYGSSYDVILMDISMPVMDGHEATSRVKRIDRNIPVIAMTAHALKGDMELCLEKGMDDYIAKPINRNLLVNKLLKWLASPNSSWLSGQVSDAALVSKPLP